MVGWGKYTMSNNCLQSLLKPLNGAVWRTKIISIVNCRFSETFAESLRVWRTGLIGSGGGKPLHFHDYAMTIIMIIMINLIMPSVWRSGLIAKQPSYFLIMLKERKLIFDFWNETEIWNKNRSFSISLEYSMLQTSSMVLQKTEHWWYKGQQWSNLSKTVSWLLQYVWF